MNFNHKHNSGFLRGAVAILAIALGTALFPGAGEKASAGMCDQTTTTSSIWECRGAAIPDMDRTQTLFSISELVVTTEPGFGMNVASRHALFLSMGSAGTSIDATIDGFVGSRGLHGIEVGHQGSGAAAINVGAVVNAAENGINLLASVGDATINATGAITAGNRGINATNQGTGSLVINSGNINATENGINVDTTSQTNSVTINATGDIRSGSRAINAEHFGRGELSISLAPNATITTTGPWGIDATANTVGHSGQPSPVTGGMNIMAMGSIGSAASPVTGGIFAFHHTRGDLNITAGNIYTTGRAIDARTGADSSALNINIIGNIMSTTAGGIVPDHQGAGDITINVAPGASVNAPATGQTAIFAGGADAVVDIAGLVRGGQHAVRTGSSADSALVRLRPGANIIGAITAAGDNTTFELAAATTPFANTPSFDLDQLSGFNTVRKTGPNTWAIDGSVTAETFSLDDGALFLDEDALIVIAGNFAGNGGRLVMSANFATGGSGPTASSVFNVSGSGELTGITPVELRISGNPNSAARIRNIVSVVSPDAANAANHFIGSAESGFYAFRLDCGTTGGCDFVRNGFGEVGRVIESYAATLAQLSSLPSMQQRLEGRVWQDEKGVGVWGRVEGSVASFEPTSTAKSEYDIQDTRIRFGADYPFEEVKGLTLGGNVWFGLANTDIAPGDGEIETTGYSVAATATMEQGNFYADGQFQYALFSSDLTSSQLSVSGSDATAFSVSGEAGYRYPLSGVNVTPQAQVIWTTADFDDFRNTRGTETASLEDGAALTGACGCVCGQGV